MIIVLLDLNRVYSDIVPLRLTELLALSKFTTLISYDLLFNLNKLKIT